MKNLLLVIAKGLVKNPEDVRVDVEQPNEKGVVVYRLYVAQSDVGRVIGKQGRIASNGYALGCKQKKVQSCSGNS